MLFLLLLFFKCFSFYFSCIYVYISINENINMDLSFIYMIYIMSIYIYTYIYIYIYIYIHLSLSHPHQHLPTHTLTHNYTHCVDSLPFYELFFFLLSYSPVLTEPWECFALISVCVPVVRLPLFCQTCVLFYHEGNTAKRKQFVLGQANLVRSWFCLLQALWI